MQFVVASPDVLGNKAQGWEINDSRQIGSVDLSVAATEDDDLMLSILSECGYLDDATSADYDVDEDGNDFLITLFETGRPVLQLLYR